MNRISIHAPAKGATMVFVLDMSGSIFQSTLPRRERQRHALKKHTSHRFQSTLPRRERPSHDCISISELKISIHAPTKGATAILHKIMNLYCGTLTNNTQINSLIININYINRIKSSILNYFLVRITL